MTLVGELRVDAGCARRWPSKPRGCEGSPSSGRHRPQPEPMAGRTAQAWYPERDTPNFRHVNAIEKVAFSARMKR
jgi:hypothetical protein